MTEIEKITFITGFVLILDLRFRCMPLERSVVLAKSNTPIHI